MLVNKTCWLKPFGCIWCIEACWLVIQKPVGCSLLAVFGALKPVGWQSKSLLAEAFWLCLVHSSICCVFPWCFHCSHQGFCSCSLLAQVMQRHLKAIKTNIYKTNRYSNTSIDIYIYMNCNDVDPRPFAMIITLQLPWVRSQNKKTTVFLSLEI